MTGESQKPYPVLNIQGLVDGSDNWDVTFDRQARNLGPNSTLGDLGWGTTVQDFVARVYDGSTLKRTITTTASAGGSVITVGSSNSDPEQDLTYTAADQNTDFGGGSAPLATLDIEIAQLDENGNEGPPRRVTLTA